MQGVFLTMARVCKDSKKSRRGKFMATVVGNSQVCDEHYRLILRLKEFPPTGAARFIQIQCRFDQPIESGGVVEGWPQGPPRVTQPELVSRQPLLRRPFSLGGRRDADDGVKLEILYRVVGAGTSWLTGVKVDDQISVIGPLGNGFSLRESMSTAAVIGGGVGIPPMIYLAEELRRTGRKATAFCGARTADLLPLTITSSTEVDPGGKPTFCTAEFAAVQTPTAISTDDGSLGARGFVSEIFERWLDEQTVPPSEIGVYSCGPEPMMRIVADICLARDIECQLALERHMACGMGTCQSCVVKIRDDSEQGWSYKLCCTDGPVFDATEIIW